MISKKKLAGLVSFVFDPLVEGPLLLILLFFTKSTASLWLLPVILFSTALVPFFFMIYALRRGLISDWETTKRQERHSLNLVCLAVVFLTLFILCLAGDRFLTNLFLVLSVLMGLYTLITFFWKISGHMTANTAFVLVINLFFGWCFWWLFALLPLVAWARLIRNKHDIWQILAGIGLASLVIFVGYDALF